MSEADVRAAFAQQAAWCGQLGSPFTALLMRLCAERLDRMSAPGGRVLDWPGQPGAPFDALPLRLAGALHGLARRGARPGLSALYPPAELPQADTLWAEVELALRGSAGWFDPWLDRAPQTNEVARSAALMAGLRVVAHEAARPVELFEAGASAGLNLLPDRYRIVLGGCVGGPADSPVVIEPAWTGPSPPAAEPIVVGRRGVDLHPVDAADPADRERLLAYVWPDQRDRLARIEAALAVAAIERPRIDRGDAADWVERHLHPAPGVTRVLMHSIAYQYFPSGVQARIAAHMARDDVARDEVAWLRYEVDPARGGAPELRLMSGGRDRLLGRGSPHLHHFTWLA